MLTRYDTNPFAFLQFSQVVGGTNMTFFNTLANLGNMWPDTFFLWFVDVITYKVIYFIKMMGKIMIYIISNKSCSKNYSLCQLYKLCKCCFNFL